MLHSWKFVLKKEKWKFFLKIACGVEKSIAEETLKKTEAEAQVGRQRIAELEKELSKAQQNEKATELNLPVAYLVMSSGDRVSAIYDIYEGDNSFGYACSKGAHHQIICDPPLADNHFMIKAMTTLSPKGTKRTDFTVKPLEGQIYGAKGYANIYITEAALDKNSSVYIGNIRFTLVTNKQ